MCLCDQLRKLVAQVRPVGRMSLEPCLNSAPFLQSTATSQSVNCVHPVNNQWIELKVLVHPKMKISL